jgi:phosphate uptake regulator
MKRKVIQIADSTQLVSLPRKWAIKHGIKKGDELEVEEQLNKIIVSTKKIEPCKDVEVDISDMDRDSLQFLIRALYKNGYDEIKLKSNTPFIPHIRLKKELKTIDIISQEISRLPGMDIFSHNEKYCIIKNITDDSPKAIENMLRRVFILILETMNDFHEGFKSNNKSILESIQLKHDNITKFYTYSQRILHKFGYKDLEKNDVLYHILEVLDEIEDQIKFSSRLLLRLNIKASNSALKIDKMIIDSFEMYYKLFYNFKLKDIFNITSNRYEITKLLNSPPSDINKKELMILAHMEQISEKIINLTISTMSLYY